MDTLDEVFHTIRPEDAKGAEKLAFFRKTNPGGPAAKRKAKLAAKKLAAREAAAKEDAAGEEA